MRRATGRRIAQGVSRIPRLSSARRNRSSDSTVSQLLSAAEESHVQTMEVHAKVNADAEVSDTERPDSESRQMERRCEATHVARTEDTAEPEDSVKRLGGFEEEGDGEKASAEASAAVLRDKVLEDDDGSRVRRELQFPRSGASTEVLTPGECEETEMELVEPSRSESRSVAFVKEADGLQERPTRVESEDGFCESEYQSARTDVETSSSEEEGFCAKEHGLEKEQDMQLTLLEDDLQKQLAAEEAELSCADLPDVEEVIRGLRKEIESLKSSLAEKDDIVSELGQKLGLQLQEIQELQETDLKMQLCDRGSIIGDLREEVERMRSTLAEKDCRILQLDQELELRLHKMQKVHQKQLDNQLCERDSLIRDLREEIESMRSTLSEKDRRVSQLEQEQHKKLQAMQESRQADLEVQLQDRDHLIGNLREEMEKVSLNLSEKESRLSELSQELHLKLQEVRDTQEASHKELEAERCKVSELEKELRAKVSLVADLSRLLETQNAEKEVLREERQVLNEEVYRLTQSLFEKQGALESLELKIREAFEKHSTLERDARTTNEQASERSSRLKEELSGAAEICGGLEGLLEERDLCHKILKDLEQDTKEVASAVPWHDSCHKILDGLQRHTRGEAVSEQDRMEEAVTVSDHILCHKMVEDSPPDTTEETATVSGGAEDGESGRKVPEDSQQDGETVAKLEAGSEGFVDKLWRFKEVFESRRREVSSLKNALKSREGEIVEKISTIQTLREEVLAKDLRISALEEEVGQLKDVVRDSLRRGSRLAEVETRVAELQHDLSSTTSRLQSRTAEKEELERRLASALAEAGVAEELKRSLCEKNEQVDALTKELAAVQEAIRAPERKADGCQTPWGRATETTPRSRTGESPQASGVARTAADVVGTPEAESVSSPSPKAGRSVAEVSSVFDEERPGFSPEWSRAVDEIVEELVEKHRSAVRLAEEAEKELRRLSCRRGELLAEDRREECRTEEMADLESRIAEGAADRDKFARRRRNVRRLAEVMADILQRRAEALRGLEKSADESSGSFADFTRADDSLEWSYSQERVMQERLFSDGDCNETKDEDWLHRRIEEICHLLSSLGRTVRDVLDPEPPPFLSASHDPRHLSGWISNLEHEYRRLGDQVRDLQKMLSGDWGSKDVEEERLDVRSEVRVDGRGNVETTASLHFRLLPPGGVEDSCSSRDGTQGSSFLEVLEAKEEAERRCEELERDVNHLASEKQEVMQRLERLLSTTAETFVLDEDGGEIATREECHRLLGKLETIWKLWALQQDTIHRTLLSLGHATEKDENYIDALSKRAASVISGVRNFLEVVRSETEGLGGDLRDAVEEIERLRNVLTVRETELTGREEEIDSLKKKAASLQKSVDALNGTLEEVEQILQKTTTDRDRYREEASSLRSKLRDVEESSAPKELLAEAQRELMASNEMTGRLQQEQDSLIERQMILENKVLELQKAAADWEHRALGRKISMEDLARRFERVVEEKSAAFLEANDLRESHSQLFSEKNRLEEEKKALLKQAEEQEQELLHLDEVAEENKMLKAELERVADRARRVEEFSAKVDTLEEEKASLEERLESLESVEASLRQTRERLADAEERLRTHEDAFEQLSVKAAELQEALDANLLKEAKLRELESKLTESEQRLAEYEVLRKRDEQLLRSVEDAKRSADLLQTTVEELRRTEQESAEEIARLSEELAEARSRLNLAEENGKREELLRKRAEEDVDRMAAEVEETRKETRRLSSQAVQTNRELASKEMQLKSLNSELKMTKEASSEEKRRSSELERKLAAVEGESERLKQTYQELKERDAALTSELEETIALARELREKLSAVEDDAVGLRREKEEMSAAVEQLQRRELESRTREESLSKKLAAVESRNEDLRLRATAAMTSARKHERERLALEVRMQGLCEQLTRSEEKLMELQRLETRIRELEEEAEQLRSEVEKHRADAVEAWTHLGKAGKELRQSKDSNTWLRMRMRQYKERLAQRELGEVNATSQQAKSGERGDGAQASSSSPMVTRMSVRARSPSKTRFSVTVSATHTTPVSASKVAENSAAHASAGVKKSLFADVRVPSPSAPKPPTSDGVSRYAARTGRRNPDVAGARSASTTKGTSSGSRFAAPRPAATSPRRAPPPRSRLRDEPASVKAPNVSGSRSVPTRVPTVEASSSSRPDPRRLPTADSERPDENCKVQ